MKNLTFFLIIFASFVGFDNAVKAQIVNIPDANFKAALVGNSWINTNADMEIQISEATAFSGSINVNPSNILFLNISDLTGIEAFTNLTQLSCRMCLLSNLNVSANTSLEYLDCSLNPLTSLNVSGATALNTLYCSGFHLTSLDVSSNTALTKLYCYYNPLNSLNLSANTALEYLYCNNNQLTYLDLSANAALEYLDCSDNQLTNLDLSANSALVFAYCNNNQLTNLNVSANAALGGFGCWNNQLVSLDLSNNANLRNLQCYSNQLTSLDLSANTLLTWLDCWSNELTSLNVNNGNNSMMDEFEARNNPSLICIQVDDTIYSNANWSGFKDSTASYSNNCITTGIISMNKEDQFNIYPNPSSGNFTVNLKNTTDATQICVYDLMGNCLWNKNCRNETNPKVDLSSQPKGIYFLEIVSDDKKSVNKIVLQ